MGEVLAFHPHLSPIATSLADEGVPVRVISRAMRIPSEDMRTYLREAVERGELIELPAEDWLPTARRADRACRPAAPQQFSTLVNQLRMVFKVTASQSVLLATLLTRDACKKEQLLGSVQHHRTSRPNLPSDMNEPQLKLIDVMVHHIRKKLLPFAVVIDTIWGTGYTISKPNREKVLRIIAEVTAGKEEEHETEDFDNVIEFKKAA